VEKAKGRLRGKQPTLDRRAHLVDASPCAENRWSTEARWSRTTSDLDEHLPFARGEDVQPRVDGSDGPRQPLAGACLRRDPDAPAWTAR
jgi:hypothetical protein